MEVLAIILAVVFLGCLYCCGWGVLCLKRAFDVRFIGGSQKYLWCGLALFFIGGLGAVYTGKGFYSIVFDSSEIKSTVVQDDEPIATNDFGCVLDWGDLRVQGNYGAITVANKSDAAVAIVAYASDLKLEARLEPNRGVRLRNGLKLLEKETTVWTIELSNGEKRQFNFEQCMPLGCDIPPAARMRKQSLFFMTEKSILEREVKNVFSDSGFLFFRFWNDVWTCIVV